MTTHIVTTWCTRDRLVFGMCPPFLLLAAAILEGIHPYSDRLAGWPFLTSLLFIGLPHGAADLLVSARLNRATNWRESLGYFSGYSSLMLVVIAAIVITPLGSIIAFAMFSAWHFGAADSADVNEYAGETPRAGPFTIAARGVLIVALPFMSQTASSLEIVDRLLQLFGSALASHDQWIIRTTSACLVVVALLILTAAIARCLVRGNIRVAGIEVFETGSILAAFMVLHPLFAMGLYFLVWHSWRHTRRVILLLDEQRAASLGALARLHLRALPLLVPTLAGVVAVLWWRLPWPTAFDVSIVALAVFVVVTPPHHFLVERLHGRDWLGLPGMSSVSDQPARRKMRAGQQSGHSPGITAPSAGRSHECGTSGKPGSTPPRRPSFAFRKAPTR